MRKQKRNFLATVTSLVLFSTVLLTKNVSVNSEPAPIFTPILRDIQNQLPKGMVLRLPSRVNIRNIPIYPQVVTTIPGRFAVSLNTQPNCMDRVCQLGIISVAENPESNNILRSRPIFSKTDIERIRAIRHEVQLDYQSSQLNPLFFPIKVRFQAGTEKVDLQSNFQGLNLVFGQLLRELGKFFQIG